MNGLNLGSLPGLAQISSEMYLKSNHPYVYGRALFGELWQRCMDFNEEAQCVLQYYNDYFHTLAEFLDDMRQSGFQEYLGLLRKKLLDDERMELITRQDLLSRLYNIDLLIDDLERFYSALQTNDRNEIVLQLLREPGETETHED